jgi:hypothetical protein
MSATTEYHLSQNGNQTGPYTETELHTRFEQGLLAPDSFVWKEGMPNWISIGEFFPQAAPSPASPPPPVAGAIPDSPAPAAPLQYPKWPWICLALSLLMFVVSIGSMGSSMKKGNDAVAAANSSKVVDYFNGNMKQISHDAKNASAGMEGSAVGGMLSFLLIVVFGVIGIAQHVRFQKLTSPAAEPGKQEQGSGGG